MIIEGKEYKIVDADMGTEKDLCCQCDYYKDSGRSLDEYTKCDEPCELDADCPTPTVLKRVSE